MNIFKNRPLFCACMLFIASSIAFVFLLPLVKLSVACISAIAVVACIILVSTKKISLNRFITIFLSLILITASAIASYSYFNVKYQKFSSLPQNDQSYRVKALMLEELYAAGASSEYTVLVTEFDGERVSFKANIECEYLANMQAGNEIIGDFTIGEFEDRIGSYEEEKIKLSEGIILALVSDSKDNVSIIHEKSLHPYAILYRWNSRLSYKLTSKLGDDVGGVCSAIFLGNKNVVPTSIQRDFRRSGASHILAISGLHMSILFGALAFLLKKLFVPYKTRAILLSFAAIFYLAFTGFSVSATRSVIMLLIVYLSMICSYSSDPLTSLSVAGTLILVVSPNAVLDAGFWMSFSATFGILVFIPAYQNFIFYTFQPHYSKFKLVIKPLVWISTIILTSLCAIAPLIIVFCIFTGEMSLFSVPSSLLLGLPTQAVLILTPLFLLLGKVPYLGVLISGALKVCTSFMIDYCETVSLRKDCMLSLNYSFSTIAAVILGIVFIVCLAVNFKRKYLSVIPIICAIAIFFGAVAVVSDKNAQDIRISYVNQNGDRNVILATNGTETVMFDMTPGYYSSLSEAYGELTNLNATEIDALVLTKYTTVHISSLSKSFQSQRIRRLYIPKPENNDDYFRMTAIMECAADNGVIVDFYNENEEICFIEGMSAKIMRETISRSTTPVTMISLKVGEKNLTYLSSSYIESSIAHDAFDVMEGTDHLIFGGRGPTPKEKYKIQNGFGIKTIIFSSDEIASYYDTSSFVSPDAKLILSPDIYRFRFERD